MIRSYSTLSWLETPAHSLGCGNETAVIWLLPGLSQGMRLNDGLMAFTGSLLFASHDHQFIQTLANRIIAVSSKGVVDRAETTYDEFLENKDVQKRVAEMNQ